MDFLKTVITGGAVVNFFTVIAGTLIGMLFKKGIPERVKATLMNGMALCVLYIGITGLFEDGTNILIIIASFAIGAVVGELADFDGIVNRLGTGLEKSLGKEDTKIADGFVTATLLFCVGAMTVVGSIDSGISGDNSTLYSKSIIDGVSSVALTSSLGIGVMLSAIPVLVIEGGLTLLASVVSPILTEAAVAHMSVIGSLLIIAIALNMLGLTKIKVMNYLPSVFLPLIFCLLL
ncbi:MAG: DUF554 domain-containing protein [Acutalibacteraceae bacterium]|nr:DUF554 domain-containing protein [Acutalibacteraceae bacterium]